MKVVGQVARIITNEDKDIEISFIVSNKQHARLLGDLNKEDYYSLDIKRKRSKRSDDQNKFLWAIIGEIENVLREKGQDETSWDIYCKLLMEAKVKYTYGLYLESAERDLREVYRAVQFMGKRTIEVEQDGEKFDIELNMYQLFIGTSKFTVDEMIKLIDIAIGWAYQYGIDIERDKR